MHNFISILFFIVSTISISGQVNASNQVKDWPRDEVLSALKIRSSRVLCLGWRELLGKEQRLNIRPTRGECLRDENLKSPGLFVSFYDENSKQHMLALLMRLEMEDQKSQLQVLWKANGKGIINGLKIVPSIKGRLSDLSFSVAYLPKRKKGERPMRPGPPLPRYYQFDGEQYVLKKK